MGTPGKAIGGTWLRPVLLSLALSAAAFAQSDSAWVFRYPGTGQGTYQPLASFVDDTGNVYVAGWTGEWGGNLGVFLIKIDSAGRLLWARTRDSMTAAGAARDRNGDIYVSCGATRGRICLLKYTLDGDLEWTRFYSEKDRHYAALGSIAIDDSQNVYACGAADLVPGSRAGASVRIVKCLPDGTLASVIGYTLRKDMSLNDGEFHIMDNGDTYLVLNVERPTPGCSWNNDWFIVRLASGGRVLWERIYNETSDRFERPQASQVDDKANVYITGDVITAISQMHAWCTMKMDSSGNVIWVKEYAYEVNSSDPPRALLLDEENVYVAGGDHGIIALQYDSLGDGWVRRFEGCFLGYGWDGIEPTPGFCPASVDEVGNLYLTGAGLDRDTYYAVLLKYDHQGDCIRARKRPEQKEAWWTGAIVGLDDRGAVYDIGTYGAAGARWSGIYVLKYRTR